MAIWTDFWTDFHPELFGILFPSNRMFNKLLNGPVYFYGLYKTSRCERRKVSEMPTFFYFISVQVAKSETATQDQSMHKPKYLQN